MQLTKNLTGTSIKWHCNYFLNYKPLVNNMTNTFPLLLTHARGHKILVSQLHFES